MPELAEITPPTAEVWDAYAEAYALHLEKLAHGPFALLLKASGAGPGSKVVDLGTGPGQLAAEAVRRGAEVVCVDFSEKMLAVARMNAPDAEMRQGDATNIPVDRRWATAVVANFVLHLLTDPVAAILDAVRVTESGGIFAATVWQRHEDNPAIGLFYAAAKQCGIEVPVATQAGTALWDKEKFDRALHRAHLHHIDVRTVEWVIPVKPDEWWTAMLSGGPVTGAFLSALDAVSLDKVRSAFLSLMNRLPKEDEEILLPARAILGMGQVIR